MKVKCFRIFLRMVLMYLSKLLLLTEAIKSCPVGIPHRKKRIMEQYMSTNNIPDDVVISVSVGNGLDRIVENHLDSLNLETRQKIVDALIDEYSNRSFSYMSGFKLPKIHLMPLLRHCMVCSKGTLIMKRSLGHNAVLYDTRGVVEVESFSKQCKNCKANYFPCYVEFAKDVQLSRKYHGHCSANVFSITNDSFFAINFLQEFNEDIFTCTARVTSIVEKYNRLHETASLQYKRVLHCWLLFSIFKFTGQLEFPVYRDAFRGIDVDTICKHLLPEVENQFESKWITHVCSRCENKCVVMDGCAKG